jgi:hypothetical protein
MCGHVGRLLQSICPRSYNLNNTVMAEVWLQADPWTISFRYPVDKVTLAQTIA